MKTFTTFSKIILNIFFLMTMSLSHGQVGSIQGKVTDEKSKEAMIGACISYSNDTVYKTVISDMNGSYKIVADPGVYKIKVQYIGYKLTEITGIVLKKDSTTIVDIALSNKFLHPVGEIDKLAQLLCINPDIFGSSFHCSPRNHSILCFLDYDRFVFLYLLENLRVANDLAEYIYCACRSNFVSFAHRRRTKEDTEAAPGGPIAQVAC